MQKLHTQFYCVIWTGGLSVGKKHQKLTGLGERMRKNILKILNLGPEILIQMVAKSHGFEKRFKQVCALSVGIIKVMANGKNICAICLDKGKVLNHVEKDCN